RIYDANKNSGKNFEIMWDAANQGWSYWAIPKGAPRRDEAYRLLAFAGTPKPQADLTRYIPYGPGNKDAMALVDPAILPHLANTPEHDAVALFTDVTFCVEKGDEVRQRFNAWLAK